jgi:hypothetical protein
MNRYIITSPKFDGEINVLYGEDNRLLHIDFLKCTLTDEQITYFKGRLPVAYSENFGGAFGTSNLTVVKEGYRITFDQWWDRYGLKRNRPRSEKLWNKLNIGQQVDAYFRIAQYERHLSLNSWKTKADPDTYLRNKYWESDWTKN